MSKNPESGISKTLIAVIVVVIVFVGLLIAYNSNPKNISRQVWNEQMAKGDKNAPNYLIEYTDVVCPHCADFHNALTSDFQTDYIDSGKLYYELRITDVLSEKSPNSTRAAESVFCAANQSSFWAYYDAVVTKLTEEYFSKGIGISATSPKIPQLKDQFYIDLAKNSDLDVDTFSSCLTSHDTLAAVRDSTNKSTTILPSGVPYFVINNKFTSSGFGGNYQTVVQMLKAGGVN